MTDQSLSIPERVHEFLRKKPALSLVSLNELYRTAAVTDNERNACRTALHRVTIGSPVARKAKPPIYFAIKLSLEYEPSINEDVIVTLPGLPHSFVDYSVNGNPYIAQIIERFKIKYGESVIDYWCRSAQYRSVDQAREGMKKAKSRDKLKCVICEILKEIRNKKHLASVRVPKKVIMSSHLVSRKTLFWLKVDEIDKEYDNIFSDAATSRLVTELKKDKYLNGQKYIVALCRRHDNLYEKTVSSYAESIT